VLFHNDKKLQCFSQLKSSLEHRGGTVPAGRNIVNHEKRLDLDSLTLEFQICTDGRAVEDAFCKVSKLTIDQ
jgi:hypothetical protein